MPSEQQRSPSFAWPDEEAKSNDGERCSTALPCCQEQVRRLATCRRDNFTKVAIFAALVTMVMTFFKWRLSRMGEHEAAVANLADLCGSIGGAMLSRFASDVQGLDVVADLWGLNTAITPDVFRQFVTAPTFESYVDQMVGIVLVHRVPHALRDEVERSAPLVERKRQCCNTSKFDVAPKTCASVAKRQCGFSGDRLHFTSTASGSPAPVDSEYAVVLHSEPFESNPGPQGFNMLASPARKRSWEKAKETGEKVFNRRVRRIFSTQPEYGLLIWNPVFVDEAIDGNKSLLQGVRLRDRQALLNESKTPYAIGSVNGVYRTQHMAVSVMDDIFSAKGVARGMKVLLFDRHPEAKPEESLLGYFDPQLSVEQMNAEVIRVGGLTMEQAVASQENVQVAEFRVKGSDGHMAVVVIPSETYFDAHRSQMPMFICIVSILLLVTAQLDRWFGHPALVGESYRQSMNDAIEQLASEKSNNSCGPAGRSSLSWLPMMVPSCFQH